MTAASNSPAKDAPTMRPVSKTFRARQIHRDMTYDGLARCGGRGDWWSQREAAYEHAVTAREAAAAAAPAVRLCTGCPESGEDGRCALRARLDSYTGLAAGQAWVSGRPRAVDAVRRGTSSSQPLAS